VKRRDFITLIGGDLGGNIPSKPGEVSNRSPLW
jgi:hypothetical protein